MISLLLKADADVNARDEVDRDPLMVAVDGPFAITRRVSKLLAVRRTMTPRTNWANYTQFAIGRSIFRKHIVEFT